MDAYCYAIYSYESQSRQLKNEGKKFSALHADGFPPHTSTHCLPHWPYHSKMLPTGLRSSFKVIAPT